MNLMTYEQTIPLIQASIYHNLHFYSEDQVLQVIDALPDDPYGQLPESENPDQHKAKKQAQEQEAPLSSKEKNGLNKYAEGLCMRDNRKASAIALYCKAVMFRDIDCQKCSTNRSCAYSSVLKQISNKDYIFDPRQGKSTQIWTLRRQVLLHCASKPEELYPLMKYNMDYYFKDFLKKQLNPNEDGDFAAILAMRHMLDVSTPYICYYCPGLAIIVPDSVKPTPIIVQDCLCIVQDSKYRSRSS